MTLVQERGAEIARLKEAHDFGVPWRKWGPYLSERQWGTVREDYSADGDAWNYVSHEKARSYAYRWGEDGLAGFTDAKANLCFALALWNGQDPILKERAFGLTNPEGNHGEDVKEYYFYIDSTPTHSYMKYLYKYPQRAFPYPDLVETNRRRSRNEFEYELLDTGVFNEDRYFDVFVEYAKASPEDVLVRITAVNRGPETATLHVLPTLWFRNTWSSERDGHKPELHRESAPAGTRVISASSAALGHRWLYIERDVPLLFTENETNKERVFGTPNVSRYLKDGINDFVVHGNHGAVNPEETGTKAAAHHELRVEPGETAVVRLRLSDVSPEKTRAPFDGFDRLFEKRRREADEFYHTIAPSSASAEETELLRQALSGMLWGKQYYSFEGASWLEEHGVDLFGGEGRPIRNLDWGHMINNEVISMPDKWEYPWYATWDLAFHAIALSAVDVDLAKEQLELVLRSFYLHPNGQIPAYEWNFSDVNPPVHPWATIFLYRLDQALRGEGDLEFMQRCFGKLLSNFAWWVNRKDRFGRNVFEGGFLGLDNVGVFDRSAPLPTGGYLEQADATAWMAMFSQNMIEIATEIAAYDRAYEELASTFIDHFLLIARAMNHVGQDGMWDEEEGFYYDVLRWPDGRATRLKVRSIVGLLPLCATTVFEPWQRERAPRLMSYFEERLRRVPELRTAIHPIGPGSFGYGGRSLLCPLQPDRLRRILAKMLDENEFLSPYGIRSLSRFHRDHPYVYSVNGREYVVGYLPAESDSGMFGGNSNWRGPVWMPLNALMIRALLLFYAYHGDSFQVECPTGSGRKMNLFEVARELGMRLNRIFERDAQGRRPVYGGIERFQSDPNWRDNILFYEYFHGDNGAGLGASHQTGWTGLIAPLIQLFGRLDARQFLEVGRTPSFVEPAA